MNDMTQPEELIEPSDAIVAEAFGDADKMAALLADLEKQAKALIAPINADSVFGRDKLKSSAFRVAKIKTRWDGIGKRLNDDHQAAIKKVNTVRNIAFDHLENLQKTIRAPVTKWEAAEDERIEGHKARIKTLFFSSGALPKSSAALTALRNATDLVPVGETWEEFTVEAAKAKSEYLTYLDAKIRQADEEERREKELADLRAEKEARDKRDAEERQKREAEESAAAQDRRLEDAKREATEKALAEAKAREELLLKQIEDEKAKAARAEQEARDAAAKALKDEADRRAKAEADKAAAKKAADEAKAKAKRDADEAAARRDGILSSITEALESYQIGAVAKVLAEALMAGKIPHCEVKP